MLLLILHITVLFSVTYGNEILTEACQGIKVLPRNCNCLPLPSSHSEARLTCVGPDAINKANDIFEYSESITFNELQISQSSLQNLSYLHLDNFQKLKSLMIFETNLSYIEPGTFKNLAELKTLDLSYNQLSYVREDIFNHKNMLQNITLAHNQITDLDPDTFYSTASLLYLDLSGNELVKIDKFWFMNLKMLMTLNLADNNIYLLDSNSFKHLTSLQTLDLSGNEITKIPSQTFLYLKNLKTLSIAKNDLETLSEVVFKGNKLLEKISLAENPWVCNTSMLPLLEWLKKYQADKDDAICIEPLELKNRTLQNGLEILYLQIKIDENPTCNSSMCNCTVSKDKLIVTVDCVGRNLIELPKFLPYKTRVLDLRNNNIKSLTVEHVDAVQWSDVSFLYLNNNHIDSLKGLEGSWLLRNLVALHLSSNRLTEIPIHILEQFRGGLLVDLYLSGNPWNCDCNTVRFQTWLQDNYKAIRDFNEIKCSSDSHDYSNQPIHSLLKSQLCPQHVQLINYLDVLNALMALAIIFIIMKLSYDYWLQKRTGKLPRFFSLNLP